MPEGPELFLAAKYINTVCRNILFDKIIKSEVSKCDPIEWPFFPFTITAVSRGKEMAMVLKQAEMDENANLEKKMKNSKKFIGEICYIFYHFGMSGNFKMTSVADIPKHSHLRFFTVDGKNVLNFIDTRRFGGWKMKTSLEWSAERGPDPVTDYDEFRSNVINSLSEDSVFNKPICEVLLNQRYFNGIGNYLRAEAMHRAGIQPFSRASDHLKTLTAVESKMADNADVLYWCKKLQEEMVDLHLTPYGDPSEEGNRSRFREWCQCYMKPGANSLNDKNGRNVWFFGEAGPLAPKPKEKRKKVAKSKVHQRGATGAKRPVIKKEIKEEISDNKDEIAKPVIKRERKRKALNKIGANSVENDSKEDIKKKLKIENDDVSVSTHSMRTRSGRKLK